MSTEGFNTTLHPAAMAPPDPRKQRSQPNTPGLLQSSSASSSDFTFSFILCSLSPGISTNLGNLTSVNATKSEAEMSPITKKYNHHLKTCPWPYCTPCGEHFALVDMALPAQFRKTQSFPFKCTRRTQLVTTSHRDHLQNLAT
jgi:hypothetical protein